MTPQTPSRRTIVKGAAWSAPVVTIAAAAPSLAASPDPTPPHDLSTSVPGTGVRQSATNLNLSPTTFNNTGSESIEGLTITFVVDNGQTITGITIFDKDIKDLVAGATTSGYGSDTVVLTLPPNTNGGVGQVSIAPGGSYKAPLGQDIGLSSPSAFTISVTVKASNELAGDVPYTSTNPVPAA
ncbi:hypothetical protein [Janibacter sp. YB324]|uniref:hypothetical protein n=1 Tax=Janibacter sp. YB324 TaxID=2761047 RepID=UPI00162326D0|nr:hypothetical protein [Janibacter sp. YB324]QNF93868.1 hypothetical protein H7A72_14225 [Janibacter sp. YB324]